MYVAAHMLRPPGPIQETCLFNEICENGDALFSLSHGAVFKCDFSEARFLELQQLLLSPWHEPDDIEDCWESKTCIETDGPGKTPTCSQCWRAKEGDGESGDCSSLKGCDNDLCNFCTNDGPFGKVVG
uniref:Uncharacterized protein n=1 Tax=Haptolina ericina TaxID=156174 RepID=A0A7S3C2S7_9EUKA|mmetsp:Transcript_7702/g.17234  ORF Transcript_7702/g.17234 Transcript_7702/m.17234 type:complete len:128 (+) Transcript_7702:901-1284(+)